MINPDRKRELMAYAARLAAKNGDRWTDMRQAVYAALLEHDKPLTAYQLIDYLSVKTATDIKPASVYRALDKLTSLHLAVKIESIAAFRACGHPEENHQHVFLVCDSCGDTNEIQDTVIGRQLNESAAGHTFHVSRQVLELHGSCGTCTHDRRDR